MVPCGRQCKVESEGHPKDLARKLHPVYLCAILQKLMRNARAVNRHACCADRHSSVVAQIKSPDMKDSRTGTGTLRRTVEKASPRLIKSDQIFAEPGMSTRVWLCALRRSVQRTILCIVVWELSSTTVVGVNKKTNLLWSVNKSKPRLVVDNQCISSIAFIISYASFPQS